MIKSQIPNPKSQTNPNDQISNDLNQQVCFGHSVIGIWVLFGIWCLVLGIFSSFAQDDTKLVALSRQIIEAKASEDLYAPFEELKNYYFKDNQYASFIDFLNSLKKKESLEPFVNYYIALTLHRQLKYLQDSQSWDEYFANGNTYRDELIRAAKGAIKETASSDRLNLYSRLILWQFYKVEQLAYADTALSELLQAVSEYSRQAKNIGPLKDIADQLVIYNEKAKALAIYKIYVDKLSSLTLKDEELKNIGLNFYQEGNLELAETVLDVYIERLKKSHLKETAKLALIEIAKVFSYKDEGLKDPAYAEKVLGNLEEIAGKDVFEQELIYLRASNLEKIKEYRLAKDFYQELVRRFPESSLRDEANFKISIIFAYILGDINAGKGYFEKLANQEKNSPQVISSLYQLGILSQWQGDLENAKSNYEKLIARANPVRNTEALREQNKISNGAKDGFIPLETLRKQDKDKTSLTGFRETIALAQERLKEIQEQRPIEYNLKVFLDSALKSESVQVELGKVSLSASPYKAKLALDVTIKATVLVETSGCIPVELDYLWSGDTGNSKPANKQSSLTTQYLEPGTKVINLTVVSPTGIVARDIDFVDVN